MRLRIKKRRREDKEGRIKTKKITTIKIHEEGNE